MLCSIIWQVLQLEYSLTCFKSYFNKWKKLSIGIDFGIGIDQNSWYRYRYRPKKLVSPITTTDLIVLDLWVTPLTRYNTTLSHSPLKIGCNHVNERLPRDGIQSNNTVNNNIQ